MAPQRSIWPISPKRPLQAVFVCAVLVLAACGCSRQSGRDGADAKPMEFRLLTSSMAPNYPGTRYSARCTHCGDSSEMPAEAVQKGWPVRCQRCGGTCSLDETVLPGTSVKVQPASRPVARFDVVGISQADGPPLLKRVWGLPGEQLEIGSGELWIDGKLLQKSLSEFRSVAIPLDAQWTRNPIPAERAGESQREKFQWHCKRPAPVHTSDSPPSDWLEPAPISDAAPIPLLAGTPPLASPDILLRFDLNSASSEIVIDYSYYGTRYQVALGTTAIQENGSRLLSNQIAATNSIEVAFCDHRLLLAGDAHAIAPVHLSEPDFNLMLADQETTISITAIKNAVRSVSLYRDIILRSTHRVPSEREQFPRLSADEYFVLGDNQPASDDSRGPLGSIRRKQILGVATTSQERLSP